MGPTARDSPGIVRGSPLVLLRMEGGVLLGLAVFAYARYGASWWLFVAVLLGPDVGMLGYVAGPRIGAIAYDAAHTYLGPAIVLVAGVALEHAVLASIGLVWFAHIGMDRALGYGLKYEDRFGHTHLGMIGGRERARS